MVMGLGCGCGFIMGGVVIHCKEGDAKALSDFCKDVAAQKGKYGPDFFSKYKRKVNSDSIN